MRKILLRIPTHFPDYAIATIRMRYQNLNPKDKDPFLPLPVMNGRFTPFLKMSMNKHLHGDLFLLIQQCSQEFTDKRYIDVDLPGSGSRR
jgi:hypothetical protein